MEQVDCIVAGAGVVGLAVARALAEAGRDVIVLEREGRIGTQTSSRNSEIVHSGIYYRPGSLMARLCVEGRRALYAYCDGHGVPADRCGKLIVATSEDEAPQLADIAARAQANGVEGIRTLSGAEARALEPELACTAALLSETTGIVDTHRLMLALQGDAEAAGAAFAFHAPVEGAATREGCIEVAVGGAAPMDLACRLFVNCAGLAAPGLARRIAGLAPEHVPDAYLAKGSYFSLAGRAPFGRLIYPLPTPGGLGIHLTFDLGRNVRFGPDVEWVETIDYDIDRNRSDSFYAAIRRYWPGLRDGTLEPAYSGIRPKIVPPGAPPQDFWVEGPRDHGVPGLVNLFGIESPGLTASLALADHVLTLV